MKLFYTKKSLYKKLSRHDRGAYAHCCFSTPSISSATSPSQCSDGQFFPAKCSKRDKYGHWKTDDGRRRQW